MFDLTPTTLHHQAKQDICRYREQSSSRISFCSGGTSKQSGKLSLFFLKKMTRTILRSLQKFASINPQAAGFNLFWPKLKCPSNLPCETIRSQALQEVLHAKSFTSCKLTAWFPNNRDDWTQYLWKCFYARRKRNAFLCKKFRNVSRITMHLSIICIIKVMRWKTRGTSELPVMSLWLMKRVQGLLQNGTILKHPCMSQS